MELEIVKSEKEYLEIVLKGEDYGFATSIKEILLEDEDVEFAACRMDHPQNAAPVLMIRTKGDDPFSALKTAIKKLKKQADDFKDALKFAKKSKSK